ncbi:MAG TPA: hypothetical protein ENK66_09650 [Arcobacter sp.]|nr:hypothetical protein [Arcobacter sp.]
MSKSRKNPLKNKASKKSDIKGKSNPFGFNAPVVFSFKELDSTQHLKETFECWDKENLLPKLLNKIKDVSTMNMSDATQSNTIKNYGHFPESNKTKYKVPTHLSKELQWASMHIQGREVVAGHIVENVFYIVFLDREHKFWISKKKYT